MEYYETNNEKRENIPSWIDNERNVLVNDKIILKHNNNKINNKKDILIIILFCFILIILIFFYYKIEKENKLINDYKNLVNESLTLNRIYKDAINKSLIMSNKIINESLQIKKELGKLLNEDNNEYDMESKTEITNDQNKKQKQIIILAETKAGTWNIGRKYIDKCLNHTLINEIPNLPDNNIPIISVIIPVYNANKTIKAVIRSIQNQNMNNYEIILVNDLSTDNSLEIIKKKKKEDKRIKIINNQKNMGTLYSRCVGVLSSKGKYIFSLDNDDMYFVDDIFEKISALADIENFDIVEFQTVFSKKYDALISEMKDGGFVVHRHNLILHQPRLALFPIQRKYRFERNDFQIWSKCINSKLYKNAVNLMGEKRYSKYVTWAEDTSMVFVIFSIAQSFKYVKKYGLFHIETTSCGSFSMNNQAKTFGEIFLTDIIFDFTRNNTNKNYAAYQAIDSTKRSFVNVTDNEENKNYFMIVLKKILKSEYITEINKQKVIESYKKFNLSFSKII